MKPKSFEVYKNQQETDEGNEDNGFLRSFAEKVKDTYSAKSKPKPNESMNNQESYKEPSLMPKKKAYDHTKTNNTTQSSNAAGVKDGLEKKLDDVGRELSEYTFKNTNNSTLKELGSVLYAKVLHDIYNDFFK